MAAVKKLAEMLLNPDVTLGPFDSFPEFQELFPPKYRDHPDARLLYRAFQRQRRVLREKVAKDIQRRYKRDLNLHIGNASLPNHSGMENQSLEQAVSFFESKEAEVEADLKATRKEIGSLEQDIKRCALQLEKANPIGQINWNDDEFTLPEELKNLATALVDDSRVLDDKT
ncbi:uncharacterized protein [Asterias amurensis]|uniref:uncharacterized protein n=1 Tax=Asterias amurensis TaxID=7602 RepID=UPI003AB410D5